MVAVRPTEQRGSPLWHAVIERGESLMNRAAYAERIAEVLSGAHGAKVGYPIGLRTVEVLRTAPLGSGLIRITFGGEELDGFHSYVPDEHVRLVFPDENGVLHLPRKDGLLLHWGTPRPVTRDYTVRRFDAVARELDIDVAVHPGGLASEWALCAEPGARAHIAGPVGGLVVPKTYDKYLLAGDITALPAIARWLEWLPREASGWVFIEVAHRGEQIPLEAPDDIEVHWVHRGHSGPGAGGTFERRVRSIEMEPDQRAYVWIAGESGAIKPLRRWVRTELGLDPQDCLITGYWRHGVAGYDRDE
ncbi:siderophore-interacting protein [Nocardia sp. IBHARD005]|uniref:siderophore-interacting protein n=1 Tax=Nocardia sp. IBHARD005 TaxID=3457765 RepID=UPI004058BC84